MLVFAYAKITRRSLSASGIFDSSTIEIQVDRLKQQGPVKIAPPNYSRMLNEDELYKVKIANNPRGGFVMRVDTRSKRFLDELKKKISKNLTRGLNSERVRAVSFGASNTAIARSLAAQPGLLALMHGEVFE